MYSCIGTIFVKNFNRSAWIYRPSRHTRQAQILMFARCRRDSLSHAMNRAYSPLLLDGFPFLGLSPQAGIKRAYSAYSAQHRLIFIAPGLVIQELIHDKKCYSPSYDQPGFAALRPASPELETCNFFNAYAYAPMATASDVPKRDMPTPMRRSGS
jgi:hypothetical protein